MIPVALTVATFDIILSCIFLNKDYFPNEIITVIKFCVLVFLFMYDFKIIVTDNNENDVDESLLWYLVKRGS